MGTFHDDMGELHGITVVATSGDTVYVGRCHEMDARQLLLLDADQHTENEDGRSNREYLERAARFGVWKKHDKLLLPTADLVEVIPLGQYYRGVGSSAVAVPAPKEKAAPVVAPVAGTDDDPVTLTPSAHGEVVRLLSEEKNRGQGLRLGVSGGGCSGLVYKVEFDARADGDVVVSRDDFEIYLDPKSVIYLRGVVLDFQAGLSGRGFQFTNPNASNTCGCGESFAV